MEGELFSRVRPHSLNRFESVAFIQRLQAHWPEASGWSSGMARPSIAAKPCALSNKPLPPETSSSSDCPGYAPDLNPLDTGVWHHLKHVSLANVCCHDLDQLQGELARAIKALRAKPHLIQACFGAAKLSL